MQAGDRGNGDVCEDVIICGHTVQVLDFSKTTGHYEVMINGTIAPFMYSTKELATKRGTEFATFIAFE